MNHISFSILILDLFYLLGVYFNCVVICRVSIPCVFHTHIELSKSIVIFYNKRLVILVVIPFFPQLPVVIAHPKLGDGGFLKAGFWYHVKIVGLHCHINVIVSAPRNKTIGFQTPIVIFLIVPNFRVPLFDVPNLVLRKTVENVR